MTHEISAERKSVGGSTACPISMMGVKYCLPALERTQGVIGALAVAKFNKQKC